MRWNGTVVAAMAAVFSLFLITSCEEGKKAEKADVTRRTVSGVRTAVIESREVVDHHEAAGTVVARASSVISSRVMGTVTSVLVRQGDRVTAGGILLTIEDKDVSQRVRAATEGHVEARKALEAASERRRLADITYGRYKRLFDEKALTAQELDQIETGKRVADIEVERGQAAVRRAEAALEEAKVSHDFTRILSPVSGVVVERRVDPGSMAVPGMPLLTIEDSSSYRIEAALDEKFVGLVKTGMKVMVTIGSLGKEIEGTVSEVVPAVDPATRTFPVKVLIKAEGVRSGLFGRVRVPAGKRSALLVPGDAIVRRGQLAGVYVVDSSSMVTYRLVRTGISHGQEVELISGLNPGETVIVEGVGRAVDGGVLEKK